jgi:hypothetical protein
VSRRPSGAAGVERARSNAARSNWPHHAAAPERQLDLGLLVDDELDARHNAEQEVG